MAYTRASPSHEMQIHVKRLQMINGDYRFEEKTFYVSPDHPLKDIKSKLQYYLDFETTPPRILLVRNGKDLLAESDDCTLHQCGIMDGDATFVLGCPQQDFQIRFTCVDYFEYIFQVDCYYTVGMLKKEIEERTGLSEDEQQLEHNGVALLMPERTLLSYGIFSMKYFCHTCDIIIHLKDNIQQYYRNLAVQVCKEGISIPHAYPDQIQIHIKTGYSSEPFTLNVSPLTRVSTQKLALERKYGSRREHLLLFMNGKDLLEEENSSLEQCGIETGVTLLLGYKGHLHVRVSDDWTLIFKIDCSDTIKDLQRIFHMVFSKNMFLSFKGVRLLKHERTLFSYGIFRTKIGSEIQSLTVHERINTPDSPPRRSTLHHHSFMDLRMEAIRNDLTLDEVIKSRPPRNYLIERPVYNDPSAVKVIIEIPGTKRVFSFMFVPDETVDNVKSVISQQMKYPLINIWKGQFVLQFEGQLLEDDSRTLDTLGIKTGSTIQLYDSASYGQSILDPIKVL